MRLTGLRLHPLKSTAIRPVSSASGEAAGLAGDRRWMVVDADGVLLSAREEHRLFTVVADTPETGATVASGLRLRAPGAPDLHLPDAATGADGVEEVPVRLHRHHLRAAPVSAEADAWVSSVLGRPGLRVVHCSSPQRRALNPAYSRPGDHTAFADGYPLTLASLRSLARLNDWIAETAVERGEPLPEPLTIDRFRPNLVVDGDVEPFAEDGWRRVRVGGVAFRVAKPVDRCVMTTIDPHTLATAKEPIRPLARHPRWDGATWFAVQLIPDGVGTVAVGDEVTPL